MPKIFTPFLFKHDYPNFRQEWPDTDLPGSFDGWNLMHFQRCRELREEGNSPEPITVTFEAFREKMSKLQIANPGCAELEAYALDLGTQPDQLRRN